MYISHKDAVCLVDEEALKRKRADQPKFGFGSGLVREALWRRIDLTLKQDTIELSLMNVDEEAALGGYWSGGQACVRHKFTWDDLNDRDFLNKLFFHEQVGVMVKAREMLEHFRTHMAVLRAAMVI